MTILYISDAKFNVIFFLLFPRDLKPENILLDDYGKSNNKLQSVNSSNAKLNRLNMKQSFHHIFHSCYF